MQTAASECTIGIRQRKPGNLTYLAAAAAKALQSCPTPFDSIDGSPPGFPVPGILQARTLEWVAISFSNTEREHREMKKVAHD